MFYDMVVEKAGGINAAGVTALDHKASDTIKTVDIQAIEVPSEHVSSPTSPLAPLPKWPTDPHSLDLGAKSETLLDAFDIAVIATTFALLVKVILVIVAYMRDRGNTGYSLDQVSELTVTLIAFNSQMTTLFTIIFALIVSMLFKRIALYRAQEGTATVAQLEQYQASGSLPGTLKAIWSLRSFNAFSVYLVFCWSWYYVGSQATSHEYTLAVSDARSTFPIAYPNPFGTSAFSSPEDTTDVLLSSINGQFVTSSYYIATALSSSGADQGGAMLIPFWGTTPDDDGTWIGSSEDGKNGWWDTSQASTITSASAIGLQFYSQSREGAIVGFGNLVGDVHFNTSFFNTTCGAPSVHAAAAFPKGVVNETSLSFNMTSATLPTASETDNTPPPASFDLWIRQNTTSIAVKSSCTINTLFLEIQMHCNGPTCKANKVRLRTDPNLPTNRSPFDNRPFGDAFFNNLLISNGIPTDNPSAGYYAGGLLMTLIANAYGNIDDTGALNSDPSYQDDTQTQTGALSIAMTQLINTYHQSSLLAQLAVPQLANSLENVTQIVAGAASPDDWTVVPFANGAHYNPHYSLSVPWVTVDALSCLFLLLCAVQSMRIRKRTIAPDIFGYVSSLTRDNPDLALPDGGSTLSGFDRARLMKHVRIRIADVSGDPEVGRVGLKHAGVAVPGVGGIVMGTNRNTSPIEEARQFQPAEPDEAYLKRDRQYL